ncbi:MAG: hypothetical protein Q9195_001793 [Heterodermia aff. obscurata]
MERPSPEEIQYQIEHWDESYVGEMHISMSICLALATVAVILRVLARRMSKASIGKDDHMIFVALFFAAGYVTGNFVVMFVTIFACRPIRAAWDPSVAGAKCLDLNLAYISQAIMNVITDFVILLLPMPILWGLHLDRNKKLQLIGIFMTGSLYATHPIKPALRKKHG